MFVYCLLIEESIKHDAKNMLGVCYGVRFFGYENELKQVFLKWCLGYMEFSVSRVYSAI